MKRKISNNKGITLIALIITIIILLILAVVSIQIVKQNGLIKRAADAVDFHNTKEKEQNATLDTMTSMIDSFNKKELEKPTKEEEKKFNPYKDVDATEDETADVTKIIAGYGMEDLSNFPSDALGIVYDRINGNMYLQIYDIKNDKIYAYTDSDEIAKPMNLKIKKWYVGSGSDSMKPLEEYKGPSPIQVSDFPSNCIYSVSYLEKIIRSFGTEPDTNELYKLSKLTPEELKQCDTQKIEGNYLIAAHNFNSKNPLESDFIVMAIQDEKDFGIIILDGKSQKQYVYYDTKGFGGPQIKKEKYNRWCVWGNYDGSLYETAEYTGKSPINLSDFTEGEIYCKSYLEKIIKSFE